MTAAAPEMLEMPAEGSQAYQVHLPHFDGPFDLLLFFIERDELDIHDIPIAQITRSFLAHIRALEALRIDLASEFILTAAQLMKIKARMLLPRPVLDAQGQVEDPRTELVNRLLAYKRYKQAAQALEEKAEARAQLYPRGYVAAEEALLRQSHHQPEDALYGLSLYRLHQVYHTALQRQNYQHLKPVHVIQQYPYTLEGVRSHLESLLQGGERKAFLALVAEEPTRLYAIFVFLVLLEMAAARQLHFIPGEGYNQFWVLRTEAPSATTDTAQPSD